MFCRPWESETPAIPSSPHRKALDRAMSWVKSGNGKPRSKQQWDKPTAPSVSIVAAKMVSKQSKSGGQHVDLRVILSHCTLLAGNLVN
jgi:hypothetical protein